MREGVELEVYFEQKAKIRKLEGLIAQIHKKLGKQSIDLLSLVSKRDRAAIEAVLNQQV